MLDYHFDTDIKKEEKVKKIKSTKGPLQIALGLIYSNFDREKAHQLLYDSGVYLSNFKAPEEPKKPNFILELVTYCSLRCENLIENCIICDLKIQGKFS
jgi:hypothetical protein